MIRGNPFGFMFIPLLSVVRPGRGMSYTPSGEQRQPLECSLRCQPALGLRRPKAPFQRKPPPYYPFELYPLFILQNATFLCLIVGNRKYSVRPISFYPPTPVFLGRRPV